MTLKKIQAFINDFNSFLGAMDSGELLCEARVPAKFPSHLDPETFLILLKGSGGTGRNALPTENAFFEVDDGPFPGDDDCAFSAYFHAGLALNARFVG
jgi:hypothetical protein